MRVSGSASNSLPSACVPTVGFGLSSASYQPTVNTITIGASQTNNLPLDQTTTYLADAPTTTFALQWSFTLIAPLSKLNAVLTQLANAQQTIEPQSTGLRADAKTTSRIG